MSCIKVIHKITEHTTPNTHFASAQYAVKQRQPGKRGGKGKNVVIMQIETKGVSCIARVEAELREMKLLPSKAWVTWNR